jgi:hypothetical protein
LEIGLIDGLLRRAESFDDLAVQCCFHSEFRWHGGFSSSIIRMIGRKGLIGRLVRNRRADRPPREAIGPSTVKRWNLPTAGGVG